LLVQVYALTSSQSLHETLDLFLTRRAAEEELAEILFDEPWKDVLRVVPIELDEASFLGQLDRATDCCRREPVLLLCWLRPLQ
jgi:hypothetical protein